MVGYIRCRRRMQRLEAAVSGAEWREIRRRSAAAAGAVPAGLRSQRAGIVNRAVCVEAEVVAKAM